MNEEKLRKRMNQRKEELQHEREELLRESLKLSNKCNGEIIFYSKRRKCFFRIQRQPQRSGWLF